MNEQLTQSELKELTIQEAIKDYLETPKIIRSVRGISKKYGINRKTLADRLKALGEDLSQNRTTKFLDYEVFDTIDTEEKAYWLGFLYADGYVGANYNQVGLGLALKDLDHMKKCKKFLKWEGTLMIEEATQFNSTEHYGKNGQHLERCRINVNNDHLHDTLIEKGCIPNKSLILKFPTADQVPEDLIYHFIRGYIDGDGTVCFFEYNKKDRPNPVKTESLSVVGTKDMLEGIQKRLGPGYLYHKPNCHENTFVLRYSCAKARKAADLIYKDATIYLDRKHDIYINYYVPRNRPKSVEAEIANTEVTSEIA